MPQLLIPLALASLLLTGAIFGFFYAWICSTMWGLDAADPRISIPAMQAMNASVRNAVFAPAFFATPFVLFATGLVANTLSHKTPALLFALAGVVYLVGGMILTMLVNVPMNEALAELSVPQSREEAAKIWAEYSPKWQVYNVIRTIVSGVSLLLTGGALLSLSRAA